VADLYAFTPAEMAALRRVVALLQEGRLGRTALSGGGGGEPGDAAEVMIALTPAGGVPAATEPASGTGSAETDAAGRAVCDLYRVSRTGAGSPGPYNIDPVGFTAEVFNVSDEPVPGGRWVPVARLATGGWVALSAGGAGDDPGPAGTGSLPELLGGGCELAALRPGDCVTVTGSNQPAVKLNYAAGHWRGGPFAWPGGSGDFDLFFDSGRMRLKLGGVDLLDCGGGCYSGGPLTGHGDDLGSGTGVGATGTGTGYVPCAGVAFRVCVECSCCEPAGWYCVDLGTGCAPLYLDAEDACDPDLRTGICSGPYDTYALADAACPAPVVGTISTGCCPSNLLAATKYLEIIAVGLGGPAECVGQKVTLTHIGEGPTACDGALNGIRWRGTLVCGGLTTVYTLTCITTVSVEQNTWQLCEDCTTGGSGYQWMSAGYIGAPSASCNPFVQPFNSFTWTGCYGAGSRYLITDTP